MNLKDKLYAIKKDNSKNRKRKIVTNIILSLIVFIVLTFTESTIYYMLNTYVNQNDFRTFAIGSIDKNNPIENRIEEIKEIPHIEDFFEQREERIIVSTKTLDGRIFEGDIKLIGKSEDYLTSISNGKYKENSIICPEYMINDVNIEVNKFTPRKSLTNMTKYVGKELSISTENMQNKTINKTFTIASTYENELGAIDHSECYVSHDIIKELNDFSFEGQEYYNFYFVSIDDIRNLEVVKEELEKKDLGIGQTSYLNYDFLNFLKSLRYYIIIVVSIFTIVFIFKYTLADVEEKTRRYSIYKSIGINDSEYDSMINLENATIIGKSFTISSLIVIILVLSLNILLYFYPFILARVIVKPYIFAIIIYYLVATIIIYVSSYYALNKIKRNSGKIDYTKD